MQDFTCHVIRANHARGTPADVVYLDTETVSRVEGAYSVQEFRLGVTCAARYSGDGGVLDEEWRVWDNRDNLNRYLESRAAPKKALWVFAHNAFFDLQACGFFEHFTRSGWVLEFYYERQLTYILVIRKKRRTIRVISTTNFFPYRVEQLGAMVGLEKLRIDFAAAGQEELARYCRRDVEIIKRTMERYFDFLRTHDMGRFAATTASQAMHAYRHRFMTQKIYVHSDEDVQKLERRAYFGGRTECFFIGRVADIPVATLDVNSMYPWVMSRYAVPRRLVRFEPVAEIEQVQEWLQTHAVVAQVELDTDEPIYALRMHRKVCFPTGRFETYLCSPGLQEAIKRGHLRWVGKVAVYEKAFLFTKYVLELYALRLQFQERGQAEYALFVKLLLNSLYGKWAQRQPIVEEEDWIDHASYAREEILDLVTGQMQIETRLMNHRWVTFGDEPAANTFTAISAHITEAARIELWRLIERAGPKRVLYCDTDSIKIPARCLPAFEGLIHPTRLGALKIESIVDRLTILGLKAYETDGERTVKGVPKHARETDHHAYAYTQFFRQATHLREKRQVGVLTKEVIKRLNLAYDKGVVQPTGEVVPFHVG